MLVITRKKNESVVINNDITVTVIEIRDDKVRLGVVGPKEVPVHRQEVLDAIYGIGIAPTPVAKAAPVAVGRQTMTATQTLETVKELVKQLGKDELKKLVDAV